MGNSNSIEKEKEHRSKCEFEEIQHKHSMLKKKADYEQSMLKTKTDYAHQEKMRCLDILYEAISSQGKMIHGAKTADGDSGFPGNVIKSLFRLYLKRR